LAFEYVVSICSIADTHPNVSSPLVYEVIRTGMCRL
jgi:hypothetical protein